jgi:hypothetical protein
MADATPNAIQRESRLDSLAHALSSQPSSRTVAIVSTIAIALAAAVCAWLSGGYFLSDDFVPLAYFGQWDHGQLATDVAAKFHASINGVQAFYRPLTWLSYALNYAFSDGYARGWLAVNLGLHLCNALLVGWLVRRLAPEPSGAALAGALLAGITFFAFSPACEVALWIACRYDALATFFTLLAGAAFLQRRTVAAVLATVAALLSKESGAVAIVFVALLAGVEVWGAAKRPATLRGQVHEWLRRVAPWVALGALYVALRVALFGSAVRVFQESRVDLVSPQHWRVLFETALPWARAQFPGLPGVRGFIGFTLVTIVVGLALAAARSRFALLAQCAVLAALVVGGGLLLPHVSGFELNGIGGRLFYQMSAFHAMALGLAVHEGGLAFARRRLVAALVLGSGMAVAAAHLAWGWSGAKQYVVAQRSMREAAAAIGTLAKRAGTEDFFVVFLPDAVGRVPFARNAQAGLMLPPVQERPVSERLLVQTDLEISAQERNVNEGVLWMLRNYPLFDVIEGRVPAGAKPRLVPTRSYCWSVRHGEMRELAPGSGATLAERYAAACGEPAVRT